jgi:hypothetical protein
MAEEQQVTTLDLDAIDARASAATPGPWIATQFPGATTGWLEGPPRGYDGEFGNPHDAEFIAHAREDVPDLVQRVRELEASQTLNYKLVAEERIRILEGRIRELEAEAIVIPEIPFPGGSTQAQFWESAASNLERDFPGRRVEP